jgi:ribosome-binding factor A
MAGLQSAHGYLQKRVASELRLKNTPTLEFLYDETLDRSLRIAELLEMEEAERRSP